jgi:hypothetical protein
MSKILAKKLIAKILLLPVPTKSLIKNGGGYECG